MCYICEESGRVGRNYKAALRIINAALKLWHKTPYPWYPASRPGPKPEGGDWLKAPTRAAPWTARDFTAYQNRTRYQFLPGTRPH